MNRIDRVSAILIQLQGRRVVKAQHIAERFKVSLRTVYRDIKSLEEAGIPVIGEAGVGYSLMEGYRLPPVMFTKEEAISFLTAEKLVEKLTDESNGLNYKSAMFKIRAVLRTTEKDLLEQIDSHIEVVKTNRDSIIESNATQTILKAIADKKVISIDYFAHYKQESSKRLVEPVGIFHLDNYWHLIGFCRMRKDYRDFRFDRISNLFITEERQRKEHLPLKEYLGRRYENRQLHPVTILVDKHATPYLSEQKYYMGFVSETPKGEKIEMSFLTASLEGFARWFLLMADHATITESEALRGKVKNLVHLIASKL